MSDKACSHCHVRKALSSFQKLSKSLDGHQPRCRDCCAAYSAARYAADPEKFKSYETAKRRAAGVRPKQVGRDPLKIAAEKRRVNARRYGLTLEEYDTMPEVCAICGVTSNGNGRALHVDHDHETDKVRGKLCHNCNVGIGNLQDSPAILRAALAYLEGPPAGVALVTDEQAAPA